MKLHRKDRKGCPHCSKPLHVEAVRCPYCESVLMDTALEMDGAETEELEDGLRHNHDEN